MKLIRARYMTAREHQELFAEAGLVDVAIHQQRSKGWICAVGRKDDRRVG